MACGGVVASAGAQLSFSIITVGSRAVGKSTVYGYDTDVGSYGSASNSSMAVLNGNTRTLNAIEDSGNTIGLTLTNGADNDFHSMVIGNLKLLESNTASQGSGYFYNWTSTDQTIADANGSTVILQLRAD